MADNLVFAASTHLLTNITTSIIKLLDPSGRNTFTILLSILMSLYNTPSLGFLHVVDCLCLQFKES